MRQRAGAFILIALCARMASAQNAAGVTVSGVVYDSIAGAPLAGATVQLSAADSLGRFGASTSSDSLGRFVLRDVPAGRYVLGFFHAMLDSLGVEAPLHEIVVDGERPVSAGLAIPSPTRLRAAVCASVADSGALLLGIVRDAMDRAPVAGVTVIGEWLELTLHKDGFARRVPRREATTGDNGWFAMCNLPTSGAMTLVAVRGADSTDLIDVFVPAKGFLRHDLFLPAEQKERLSGKVTSAARGEVLPGAQVRMSGVETRANERGEWVLADAPAGTRILEVRAVGYYPERRTVDVVAGAGAAPIQIALSTMKAVLDTVKITATRISDRDRIAFLERRRTTGGRFLTAEDIARRGGQFATDVFRSVPGLRIGFATDTLESDFNMIPADSINATNRMVLMRGISGNYCAPAIFLNGLSIPDLRADDIDSWARSKELTGIEIYSESATPPQYQRGPRGCGSIVMWKKGP